MMHWIEWRTGLGASPPFIGIIYWWGPTPQQIRISAEITQLHQPASIIDPLSEIARDGARQMVAAAPKAEAMRFVAQFTDERLR